MLFYFKLAWRNLIKNYRRSAKTILAIMIGLGSCLLAQGFMSHTLWGLRESLINGGTGHLQLYHQGYLEHNLVEPYRYLIADADTVVRQFKGRPEIKLLAPRLNFQGMIAAGEKSAVFMGTAGLAKEERLLNTFITLKEGSFIDAARPLGVVIGSGVARKLQVTVGDTVTLMSSLKSGGVNALDVHIVGIIEVQIKAYNDVVLFANLETIQKLIDLPGSVDRLIVLLTKTEKVAEIEPYLRKTGRQMGLEYRDWRQLAGKQYTQPKLFYDLVYRLMMTIIVLVVIFSITNTLNLTVHERVREVGTIRSLGTTRLQVGKIFVAESSMLGLVGVVGGIVVGYGLAALFNALGGIPIPPPPGQARGYTALFKPDLLQTLWLGGLFLVTTTVAGFYPAFRAARLEIVEALRWV